MDNSTAAHAAPPAAAPPAPAFNSEPVALFWVAWGGFWTVMVLCGMIFLFKNRRMPFLKIRGLGLSFGAVILLHLYWLSCQIGLSIGAYVPDNIEFWIMGLYLPFGIALFHASNSRFLHVADAQKRYAEKATAYSGPKKHRCSCKDKTLMGRFRKLDYSTRIVAIVCVGMLLQLILTVTMFLVSRKYHPWFGIPGTEVTGTPMQQSMERGRGWEWWPSIFWQFFWAWMVAPVILWKSRDIKDTQGWRLQTLACCIASLPATPMWLVAVYVPAMAPVNRYFIPPQWICLSINFIEIFTIFIPCWQVVMHKTLRKETLESIANWEAKRRENPERRTSFVTDSTKIGSATGASWKFLSDVEKATGQSESVFTMGALDYVLEKNPEPLRKFSALRDFSGENIGFLSAVADWKSAEGNRLRSSGMGKAGTSGTSEKEDVEDESEPEINRKRFNQALHIYAEFISPRHAEFQVNIASHDLRRLEDIFEDAARILYGDGHHLENPAVPFETSDWVENGSSTSSTAAGSSDGLSSTETEDRGRAQYFGEIPQEFSMSVYDAAENSIKYLVLTNTWPKFVKEGRASISEHSIDSADTDDSRSPLARISVYLRNMKY
ncbi:hypothetical protein MCOR25_009506 [Pyricularia grisea]|nr:hypothetical protein MCOR25_009506 [Pyricularia grisea]